VEPPSHLRLGVAAVARRRDDPLEGAHGGVQVAEPPVQRGDGRGGLGGRLVHLEALGHRQRLARVLRRLLVPALVGEAAGVQAERPGAQPARLVADQRQGFGGGRRGVLAALVHDRRRSPREQQPGPVPRVERRGGLVELVAHQRHRPHGMAGGGHRLAGPAHDGDEVDPVGYGGGRPRQ
jgi:hypothetical protein